MVVGRPRCRVAVSSEAGRSQIRSGRRLLRALGSNPIQSDLTLLLRMRLCGELEWCRVERPSMDVKKKRSVLNGRGEY